MHNAHSKANALTIVTGLVEALVGAHANLNKYFILFKEKDVTKKVPFNWFARRHKRIRSFSINHMSFGK